MSLPPLPACQTGEAWSPDMYRAASVLNNFYRTADAVLISKNIDLHRIQHHKRAIIHEALPLLLDVEGQLEAEGENALDAWLQESAENFGAVLLQLEDAEQAATGMQVY
jgi:hypothetical protein